MTTQAAAVLGAYRHLANVVTMLGADRLPEVMRNMAAAAATLDPRLLVQVMHPAQAEEQSEQAAVVRGVADAFDDLKVAQLMATSLALDGRASTRLAEVFDTLAPDAERKRRVLTLTRSLLSEADFGKLGEFDTIWKSMEELLFGYDDRPFVSAEYQQTLDGLSPRVGVMATDLPAETAEWIATLDHENVRQIWVTLHIDLLRVEIDPDRADDLARDMEGLTADLLLAGEFGRAHDVAKALAAAAHDLSSVAREPWRLALDRLGSAPSLREAVALLDQMGPAEFQFFKQLCGDVGAACIEALQSVLTVETDTEMRRRGTEIILTLGAEAVPRLIRFVETSPPYAQRTVAGLLGQIATKEAVPPLRALLRSTDPHVVKATLTALTRIHDSSASRAVHTAVRAATGAARRAIVEALVAERDPRIVRMLAYILAESEVLRADHAIVLEMLEALGRVGGDAAVAPVKNIMGVRSWFARRRVKAIKAAAVTALIRIGTPRAAAALDEASRSGDRLLRRTVRRATA